MWKRTLSCGILLLFMACLAYGENNEVLLRVNGENVTTNEFGRYLKKYAAYHHRVKPQDYLSDFVLFKLKVTDALMHRWDTLPDFKRQYMALREDLLKQNSKYQKSVEQEEKIGFSCLTLPLPQRGSKQEEAKACACMDSVYAFLRQGGSFDDIAARWAERIDYRKEVWESEVCLLNEFKEQLSVLQVGNFSSPFFSPMGLHIIRFLGRKEGNVVTPVKYPQTEEEETLYWKEIYDGLLASYWDRRVKVLPDDLPQQELEDYFYRNRKKYEWEFPHFKGAVVHCSNKKVASKIKKRLKKLPMEQWVDELSRWGKSDSIFCSEIEVGLFQIGTNAYVDKLSFKCGEYPVHPRYAYSFVMGKRLKKGPDSYRDVYDEVVKDFRKEKETVFLENLMQRFHVEIKQDVLKTVNCDRNNEE